MAFEKYTSLLFTGLEKENKYSSLWKIDPIKGIFLRRLHLSNFLAHIGVEDEESKSLRLFQPLTTITDHLIEVVILNHREALFYDIVTICLD